MASAATIGTASSSNTKFSSTKTSHRVTNEANQEAFHRMYDLWQTAHQNPNSNYAFSLRRAMRSLADCKEPIQTYKDALTLKYVGPRLAKLICPKDQVTTTTQYAATGTSTNSTNSTNSTALDDITNIATNQIWLPASLPITKSTKATNQPTKKQFKQTKLMEHNNNNNYSSSNNSTTSIEEPQPTKPKIEVGPTPKQLLYDKLRREAETLVLPPNAQWKVLLLVDGREPKAQHVVAKCQQSGIPCEERHLPIGDMCWIAQCQQQQDGTLIEVLLGTILERKDTQDLASSLFGTRYLEQRLRLQHCGLPQVLFLVEGDLHACTNCPAETLHMAMMETRVQLGFQIVQTAHMQDTVRLLQGLHRRIVQRAFPHAFAASNTNKNTFLPDFGSNPQSRKRRRPTSLLELVFDTPPIPAFGQPRFITYPELKAKIARDREAGTRTVGAVYRAMLKQVPTLSHKKCHAIARSYPTFSTLMTALQTSSHPETLVKDIACDRQKVGPKSAYELYQTFCTDRDGTLLPTIKSTTHSTTVQPNATQVTVPEQLPLSNLPPIMEDTPRFLSQPRQATSTWSVSSYPSHAQPEFAASVTTSSPESSQDSIPATSSMDYVDLTQDTPQKAASSVSASVNYSLRNRPLTLLEDDSDSDSDKDVVTATTAAMKGQKIAKPSSLSAFRSTHSSNVDSIPPLRSSDVHTPPFGNHKAPHSSQDSSSVSFDSPTTPHSFSPSNTGHASHDHANTANLFPSHDNTKTGWDTVVQIPSSDDDDDSDSDSDNDHSVQGHGSAVKRVTRGVGASGSNQDSKLDHPSNSIKGIQPSLQEVIEIED